MSLLKSKFENAPSVTLILFPRKKEDTDVLNNCFFVQQKNHGPRKKPTLEFKKYNYCLLFHRCLLFPSNLCLSPPEL